MADLCPPGFNVELIQREIVCSMENFLTRLPRRPQPFWIRGAGTTAIMAMGIGLQLVIARFTGLPGLFLLVAGIFIASILFDHISGIYAALLGTISVYFVVRHMLPQVPSAPVLVLFFAVGVMLAVVVDALRRTMERAVTAERAKEVLFRDLADRMHGNLAVAISLLDMQGRAHDNPEVRAALNSAADRINIIVEGQNRLRPEEAGLVEMRCFLGGICAHLSRSIEAARSIEIDQNIERVFVSAEKAVVIGLVANELVNNALRYAFPGQRPGRVVVSFAKDDKAGELILTVADDGVGCPADAPQGFGTRLVQGLTLQHGGRVVRADGPPGGRVEVRIPAAAPAD